MNKHNYIKYVNENYKLTKRLEDVKLIKDVFYKCSKCKFIVNEPDNSICHK